MLHTVAQDEVLYKNRHHFSKETLIEIHSSHILTLGSPLKVGLLIERSYSLSWVAILVYIGIRYNTPTRIKYIQTLVHQI